MPKVAVIGPVNVDLFIRGEAPLERATLNQWVGPADVDLLVAGSVGYTVQALTNLGAHVDLCSTFGDDAFGSFLRDALQARGVGLELSRTAAGETAIAIYFLMFGGAKRPMTYRLPGFEPWPEPIPIDDLRAYDVVHCGGLLHFPNMWHRGLAGTFAAARAAGVMTSLDPQFPLTDLPAPWLPHLADVLPHVDVFLCDERESMAIFGTDDADAALRAALRSGPHTAAVKLGSRGALIGKGDELIRQPAVAIPEDQVRDAVGAGDAFDAGLLDALLRGASLVEAGRFATGAAAVTLTGRGGSDRIKGVASVEAMLASVPQAVVAHDPLHHS
jgi:sugar/nucleoside kinase (ribokinase family)